MTNGSCRELERQVRHDDEPPCLKQGELHASIESTGSRGLSSEANRMSDDSGSCHPYETRPWRF